ncbi:hypothetical protein VP275E431_P0076 [Vibrio phage 275E43-1]|nr:hypothetical protein VP275E431_P0076 [Vibrio phage 275E43-1]
MLYAYDCLLYPYPYLMKNRTHVHVAIPMPTLCDLCLKTLQ